MPNWLEIVLLAVASMFWPTLITIVVLALRVPQPVRILAWFLFGGLLTTITIGLILVFALQDTSFVSGSSRSINPVLNIAAGLFALGSALYLSRRKHTAVEPAPAPADAKKSGLTERAVERGRRRGSPATDRERACRSGSASEEVPTCEPGHDVRDKNLKKRSDGG